MTRIKLPIAVIKLTAVLSIIIAGSQTTAGQQSTENVVWTNVVGATASGNSLTKTAATAWGNSGASSIKSFASGDGYVEFTAAQLGVDRICGLSKGDSNQSHEDIDFGILLSDGGYIYAWESGVMKTNAGPYAVSDTLRVSVEGGVVKYRKNGVLFYTSTVTPAYPLLADTSLYSNGSTLSNVVISGNLSGSTTENVVWTNVVGATASGNSLTKTAATAWGNSGASSIKSFASGDGYVEFTAAQLGVDRICGLSKGDSNQSHEDIDFGILLSDGGYIYAWESGVMKTNAGPYTVSDTLRVSVEGGVVKYRKNGTVFYTSTVAPAYPLLADTALYANGSTISNVVISGNLSSSSSPGGNPASDFVNALLDPLNETGGAGENPLSRNFNWTLPLVSLPGRAGLNLSLSLSYNSLVWLKSGNTISFDPDGGFPGPGFRVGFPVIGLPYFNNETGKYAYLVIRPDGSRTELRQVGTTSFYEAADSSYLMLDSSTMILCTGEGMQLKYVAMGARHNCIQIKDRNGNYITIQYNGDSNIQTITDTLGRHINFNYTNGRLDSISQTWNQGAPQQRIWASFTYDANQTVNTNFPGLTVYGPANGSKIAVLSKVTLADGSHSDFSYTSWGQVWKVSNYAPNNNLLNYRSYDLPQTNAAAQTDCPRFTARRDWAKYWNGDAEGTPVSSEEAVTSFAVPASASWQMPNGQWHSGTLAQVTAPDGTSDKLYFSSKQLSGPPCSPQGSCTQSFIDLSWQRGRPALVETYDSSSNSAWQRQVMTTWTQDNTAVSYPLNPRVTETNIYDRSGNRRRTTIGYQTFTLPDGASCSLPNDIAEYAADATTVLRRKQTIYETSATYLDRRIIGLPTSLSLADGAGNRVSQLLFHYDLGNGYLVDQGAAVQHDGANYGVGFLAGRGNLSVIRQFDVTDSTNTAPTHNTNLGYNTHGSVVFQGDTDWHTTVIKYTDSFSDGNTTRNTFAYPTTITDPDGFSSALKYNFDFGAVTSKRTPKPGVTTNTLDPEQTFSFDALGRLERITNTANGAYMRLVYDAGQIRVNTYATIEDGKGEAYSFHITDGVGRVIATAQDHPSTSGRFSAQKTDYDVMGRVSRTSNPTETTAAEAEPFKWTAAGDDDPTNGGAGWVYSRQSYDWKGRPLVITNQDGTTKTASYTGCGCAGGEVITLTDEGTLQAGVIKKRQQKIFKDVLGRVVKTQALNWEGGSPYSTTVNTYNARDQITLIRQYEGEETSTTVQETSTTYDGFGRIKTRHSPEMQADPANNLSSDHVTYDYSNDDRIQKVTDARGATTTFLNNGRGLVYSVRYTAPSGIAVPADVTYTYDGAGNRTSMTDGSGRTDYTYDSLSRMTSEARQFTAAGLAGTFTLSYTYNLAGLLKSITDPSGAAINYTLNAVGRPTAVTGSSFGGVSSYVSNLQYRASGALKHMNYSNGKVLDQTYTTTLRPLHFEIPGIMSKNYEYHPDGRIRYSADLMDNRFDRSYGYDHLARLTEALSGPAARGLADTNDRPYKQFYFYDAMDHLTGRFGRLWNGFGGPFDAGGSYINNRSTSWQYDANGQITASANEQFTYDAGGRSVTAVSNSGNRTVTRTMDGDGIEVKRVDTDFDAGTATIYNVYSSVLGRNITELNELGQKTRTFVYLDDEVLATQLRSGSSDGVLWEYRDASNATYRAAGVSGVADRKSELDPSGGDAGVNGTQVVPRPVRGEDRTYPSFADILSGRCFLDGIAAPCGVTSRMLRAGSGVHWKPGTSITSGLPQPKKKPAEPTPTLVPPRGGIQIVTGVYRAPGVAPRTTTTVTMLYGGVTTVQKRTTDEEGVKEDQTDIIDFNESLPTLVEPPQQGAKNLRSWKPIDTTKLSQAEQQRRYEDCVSPYNDAYWAGLKPAAAHLASGALTLGLAFSSLKLAWNAANAIGAGEPLTAAHLLDVLHTLKVGGLVAVPLEYVGITELQEGFKQLFYNRITYDRAEADCARKLPKADRKYKNPWN